MNTQAPPPPNTNEAPGNVPASKLHDDVETAAEHFVSVLKNIDALGSRELSLAKTKVEEAVMWAKAHIAKL